MDRKIQKLKKLVDSYLKKSKDEITAAFGIPLKGSDDEVWFYNSYHYGLFREEIFIFFEKDRVVDIIISEFFLSLLISSAYYFEGKEFDYKLSRRFGKKEYYCNEKKL